MNTLTAEQIAAITERNNEAVLATRLAHAEEEWNEIYDNRRFEAYADDMGSYYFSRETMRFFHTFIYDGIKRDDAHVYMRISDMNWNEETVYSIVRMNVAGKVEKHPDAENLLSLDAVQEIWNSL